MIGIGSTVGNYRVVKKLGSGAMGSVFLAEHPMIGKRVALKVIHSDLAENEEMVSRFFNEARAVTRIGHDNIVEVIDFGQTPDGDNFIVMELLEGHSLGDSLKDGQTLSMHDTLTISAQIADGLQASHAQGIVHRDLKPDNVYLIERMGQANFVKILDFGLAKLTQGGGAISHKTRAGSVLGTPHYMAPEQCEGKPDIDHRVDVYALGCILYQMLCGRVPFPGEGFGEVLVKHLREPPVVPSKINPEVPRSVEAIILHALAKRKEFRFQSMTDMARALRDPDKWAREIDGDGLMRGGTGEMTPPMARPAAPPIVKPAPEPAGPVAKADDAAPTMLDRAVPEAVANAMKRQGPPPISIADAPAAGTGAATMMMEAPVLPPRQYLETDVNRVVRGPGPSNAARRFAVIAGAASLAIIGAAVAVRVASNPASAGATSASTPPAAAAPQSEPSMIGIVIQTVPAGAEVLRDGMPVGATPMVLKVPAGTRKTTLTLRKEGFEDEIRPVEPTVDPHVTLTMRPAAPAVVPEAAVVAPPRKPATPAAPTGEHKPRPRKPKAPSHTDDILAPSF